MMFNNCVFLPAVGKQTQLFHITFTEPGKVILEVPCIAFFILADEELAW